MPAVAVCTSYFTSMRTFVKINICKVKIALLFHLIVAAIIPQLVIQLHNELTKPKDLSERNNARIVALYRSCPKEIDHGW